MTADAIIAALITLYFFVGIFLGLAWSRLDSDISAYLKPPVCFSKRVRAAMVAWVVLWPLALILLWAFRDAIRKHPEDEATDEDEIKEHRDM